MERVKTGVPGLDEVMRGGIPKNQLVLLTGTAGTGKTILCSQYIYHGLRKYNPQRGRPEKPVSGASRAG